MGAWEPAGGHTEEVSAGVSKWRPVGAGGRGGESSEPVYQGKDPRSPATIPKHTSFFVNARGEWSKQDRL